MDSITVKVSDLWEKVQQMKNDGMGKVTITLLEPEEDFPASINFVACKESDKSDWESDVDIDYDDIEAI